MSDAHEIPLTELERTYVMLAQRDAQQLVTERLEVLIRGRGFDPKAGPYNVDVVKGVLTSPHPEVPEELYDNVEGLLPCS